MFRLSSAVVVFLVVGGALCVELTPEEHSLAPYGDANTKTWLRFKRSCGSCCGGGSCCGMQSPCAQSCCSMPAIAIPLPPPCACGSPGCACGCPCGAPGCSCGPPPCACGSPGCSCSQTSLVIPVQTCCKCCQPVCATACIQGGGCSCGCTRGGCRRKRDLFAAINAYESGLAVPASNL
ncbi:hypothetical protein FO519_004754 [Halicephalobus sp. NKZ332]|nr:hypothetical protein FO519_004754 [Halicephalobus sp. NKZ332]